MKGLEWFLPVSILFTLIIGCNNQKEAVNTLENMKQSESIGVIDSIHNSRNSLDWEGIYTGILPCADCIGIQTQLTLNKKDGSYIIKSIYLGKSESVFSESGTYTWSKSENVIICSSENEINRRFKVEENYIRQLDNQGKEVVGDLGQQYMLNKSNNPVENKLWKFVEILGQEVKRSETKRKVPHLLLRQESFSASGGCNSAFGAYQVISKGNQIKFSDVAMTEMMCSYENYDQELLEVLNRTQQYLISKEGQLQLIVGKAAPLAKLEAVSFN